MSFIFGGANKPSNSTPGQAWYSDSWLDEWGPGTTKRDALLASGEWEVKPSGKLAPVGGGGMFAFDSSPEDLQNAYDNITANNTTTGLLQSTTSNTGTNTGTMGGLTNNNNNTGTAVNPLSDIQAKIVNGDISDEEVTQWDLNGDGKVDMVDYQIMLNNQQASTPSQVVTDGDQDSTTEQGDTDSNLSALNQKVGTSQGLTSPTGSDQPTTLFENQEYLLGGQSILGSGQENISSAIGTPSEGEGTLFTGQENLADQTQTGFVEAQEDRELQTKTLTDDIKSKFDITDEQLQNILKEVLEGNTALTDNISNLSDKTTTLYGGLADTQADIQTGLGGVQTGLDEFKTDYTADTADAIQARADLASNLTGGFAKAEDDRQNLSNIASKDAFNIQGQIASANEGVLTAQTATQTRMSDIARMLSMNVGANTPESVNAQNSYLSKLNKIKQQVNDSSFASSADPKLYNAYLDISQAFDDNGKLIATTNMMNGTESRALDVEGNLMVANFDTTGTRTAQNVYNMNQLFSTVTA